MTPVPIPLHYARHTDTGRVREHNEDAYGTPDDLGVPPAQVAALGVLLVVADGMGGRAAGEDASRLAVRTLYERFYADSQPDRRAAMGQALAAANAAVKGAGEADLSKAGMGSTVVALVCHNNQAFVAHAGDSRAYRLRGGKLESLTGDHTWVAESVAAGVITQAEAANHPYRHSLTRALGLEATVNPTLSDWFPLVAGDRFLLCSDGLTNEIKPSDLARWLAAGSAEQAAGQLVARARAAGGRDNITAVVGDGGAGGAAVPAAATGAGKNGRGRWLLAAAGILVGIVVIGAIVINARRNEDNPMNIAELATATSTPMPTSTPTSRPPTSTVAPLTSTPTSTPTPVPTATPTPTPMTWDELANLKIVLDDKAIQALGDKARLLCQGFRVEGEICQPKREAINILISGRSEDNWRSLTPDWGDQSTFIARLWPLKNRSDLGRVVKPGNAVTVLGQFPDWRPLLVMSANETVSQECLYAFSPAGAGCDNLGWAAEPGWQITASRDSDSTELQVVLQAGAWERRSMPPTVGSASQVRFVPFPDLKFRLNRSTLTYER